ncbi:hypothetical protein NIES2119_12255 [[Phormidium ambiguum] IAM M-71]|uniref:Acyltransferase 3 domain-containing protein n=1 Tax=[Phormidium ambiguum] IAM M-71 TaxID=454136 RepID=A0A1U7IKY6_9CYAN|nr:acyltransferase [Phormidium ambiguum]OKH37908.1 hypothetical protein NIES2119_12255 [Phormidium ambiguum IAM M-71]
MTTNRDGFIDFSKGFLILWVVQIHTVFWSGQMYISDLPRELSLLIDVGLFFFISGYLTKVLDLGSLVRKSFKQFKNLYLEYLILSCLLLVPLGLFYFFKEKSFPNWQIAIISMLKINPIGDLWEDLGVFPGSLWYLAVYFSLLAVVPFFVTMFGSRKHRIIILTTVLVLFVIFSGLGWNYPFLFTETIYVFFYLFIFLLGTAYKLEQQNLSLRYLKLSLLANVTVCLLIFFFVMDGILQLIDNKFFPTVIYLPYCLMLIHVFAIVRKTWNYGAISSSNQLLPFLEWCGKNSYVIYLMQGIVCSIPGYFIPLLLKNDVPKLGIYLISLLFNLTFTLLLSFIWNRSKSLFSTSLTTITAKIKVH